jgi:uncharacterized membrane protein
MAQAIANTHEQSGRDGLRAAAATWLVLMLLGQWAFFLYIAAFYGGTALSGDFAAWNRLAVLGPSPHVPGDTIGNLAFLGHALAAGLIALGGALQLVPWIRARFPRFHRWNGRVFLLIVVGLSLSGFYLVWIRSDEPVQLAKAGTSLNGVLILGFAALAWRAIRRRDIAAHREWALRLYLVANAQWFMRVGVFGYIVFTKASGFAPMSLDSFFTLWGYGCILVPLGLLQFYLVAKRSTRRPLRIVAAATLFAATLAMAVGALAYGGLTLKLVSGAPLA